MLTSRFSRVLAAIVAVSPLAAQGDGVASFADAGSCLTQETDAAKASALLQGRSKVRHAAAQSEVVGESSVVFGTDDDECPDGYEKILSEAMCRAALPYIESGKCDHYDGKESSEDWPSGCYVCSDTPGCKDGAWFNSHERGGARAKALPLCQRGFLINPGGTVFVGDSDVSNWHTSTETFPGSYNLGIGGATCKDVGKEISFILENFEPAQVVLVCGENDLDGTSAKKTFARWKSVVEAIIGSGAKLVVMGTKPEPGTTNIHRKYRQFDKSIRFFVERLESVADCAPPMTFVDVFPAFLEIGNSDSLYDPDELPDALHMGPAGYVLWNKWVVQAFNSAADCIIWQGDTCSRHHLCVVLQEDSEDQCPDGYEKLTTEADCHSAVSSVKIKHNHFRDIENEPDWPAGCYYCSDVDGCGDGTWFNEHSTGSQREGVRQYCKKTA